VYVQLIIEDSQEVIGYLKVRSDEEV
jgi:hypothetical protein